MGEHSAYLSLQPTTLGWSEAGSRRICSVFPCCGWVWTLGHADRSPVSNQLGPSIHKRMGLIQTPTPGVGGVQMVIPTVEMCIRTLYCGNTSVRLQCPLEFTMPCIKQCCIKSYLNIVSSMWLTVIKLTPVTRLHLQHNGTKTWLNSLTIYRGK